MQVNTKTGYNIFICTDKRGWWRCHIIIILLCRGGSLKFNFILFLEFRSLSTRAVKKIERFKPQMTSPLLGWVTRPNSWWVVGAKKECGSSINSNEWSRDPILPGNPFFLKKNYSPEMIFDQWGGGHKNTSFYTFWYFWLKIQLFLLI